MNRTRSKRSGRAREVVDLHPLGISTRSVAARTAAPPTAPGAGSAGRGRCPTTRRRGGRARSCRSRRCSRCRAPASPSGPAGGAARAARHLNAGKSPSGWSGAVCAPSGRCRLWNHGARLGDLALLASVGWPWAALPVRLQGSSRRAGRRARATWRSSSSARRAGVCSREDAPRAPRADRPRSLGASSRGGSRSTSSAGRARAGSPRPGSKNVVDARPSGR